MWRDDPASLRPMLASTASTPLHSKDLAYERKYDGIRAVVTLDPASGSVRIWSRLGNDKTAEFPEIAARLGTWARGVGRPVVLDGEIVAVDKHGQPVSFQHLQGRLGVVRPARPARRRAGSGRKSAGDAAGGTALVVFDLLRDDDEDLRLRPLRERRRRLEQLWSDLDDPLLRLSEQRVGDGRALAERAEHEGWEGLIAKRLESRYVSGRRSSDWRKLKLVRHQTCVVGGWTEPRGTRPRFGALILGVYDAHGQLQPVGHSGSGFSDAELERVWKRLRALETTTCPFASEPRTNERPHWVTPTIVVEVKFTEWTADGQLRHPTYLGLRDDIAPDRVRREPDVNSEVRARVGLAAASSGIESRKPAPDGGTTIGTLLAQVDAIEHGRGSGTLHLPSGDRLAVTNLAKLFWPEIKLTKGDLFRHYLRVAPYILPALADRPLVMKRYPNGVEATPFYQQRAPAPHPPGVRIETVAGDEESTPRIVGGSLTTLLYTAQLAAISQDPWLSRVQSPEAIDHAVIDLDPPDDLPFARVLDVARWVRDELDGLRAPAFPKLSGAGGLHVYVPMPSGTSYEAGLLFCQIVATIVSSRHPETATVERAIKARGRRVYVDYLQNGLGKTLASVYSARSNAFAGVSTPVTWAEVEAGVRPQDFTIRNFAARLAAVGDLWAALRKSKGANLRAAMRYAT